MESYILKVSGVPDESRILFLIYNEGGFCGYPIVVENGGVSITNIPKIDDIDPVFVRVMKCIGLEKASNAMVGIFRCISEGDTSTIVKVSSKAGVSDLDYVKYGIAYARMFRAPSCVNAPTGRKFYLESCVIADTQHSSDMSISYSYGRHRLDISFDYLCGLAKVDAVNGLTGEVDSREMKLAYNSDSGRNISKIIGGCYKIFEKFDSDIQGCCYDEV